MLAPDRYLPAFACKACAKAWIREVGPKCTSCEVDGVPVLWNEESGEVQPITLTSEAPMRKAVGVHETYPGRILLECGHEFLCARDQIGMDFVEIGCVPCHRQSRRDQASPVRVS